jgi:GrpB-like predicted nucleotidyltransferase (UPF0157 family)
MVLREIVQVLGDLLISPNRAMPLLEAHFKDALLIQAGTVGDVERHAEKLRLAITIEEAAIVLDHIGSTGVAGITIEHVEDTINGLFPDRFIEPGN